MRGPSSIPWICPLFSPLITGIEHVSLQIFVLEMDQRTWKTERIGIHRQVESDIFPNTMVRTGLIAAKVCGSPEQGMKERRLKSGQP
jgi:hypothetical protein